MSSRAQSLQTLIEPGARLHLLIRDHAETLVDAFYDVLLEHKTARSFLHHSVVQERLSPSLRNWLLELFPEGTLLKDGPFEARQKKIGEVHARIKIPVHLVLEGATVLKSRIADLIDAAVPPASTDIADLKLANERIDTALMLMCQSYERNTIRNVRTEEAYRLFSLDQDVHLERESQRAQLMEWSQKTLFHLLDQHGGDALGPLSDSPFGLWIRHRAGYLFEHSVYLEKINSLIDRIDTSILPSLGRSDDGLGRTGPLKELQTAVDEILFLLQELFQGLTEMESGRDPLTRTLNRRFLPSILTREIGFANTSENPLSILLLDVDDFKQINDRLGHQTGDLVLRQVAEIIGDTVRASDFVFRYGGEEFLIALVETEIDQAGAIAERIRAAIAERELHQDGQRFPMTVSIGVAQHQGHPDQEHLIKAADDALYRAKRNGKNRIEHA